MKQIRFLLVLLIVTCFLCGCGNDGHAEQYEVYITLGEECTIITDAQFSRSMDGHLTVSLVKTQGPTEFELSVLCRASDEEPYEPWDSFSVTLGTGRSLTLPADATFQVLARSDSGPNGYATFLVALS